MPASVGGEGGGSRTVCLPRHDLIHARQLYGSRLWRLMWWSNRAIKNTTSHSILEVRTLYILLYNQAGDGTDFCLIMTPSVLQISWRGNEFPIMEVVTRERGLVVLCSKFTKVVNNIVTQCHGYFHPTIQYISYLSDSDSGFNIVFHILESGKQ